MKRLFEELDTRSRDVKPEKKFGIKASKEKDFSEWYKEVLTLGEMVEYHGVGGCYVLRPRGFFIWNVVKEWFTSKIKEMGVEECYYPMLVQERHIEMEKNHIENFSPEVVWLDVKGEERVAIRPTSETIIYQYFARWIQSHRDLPLKHNQWCNVLRWETTQTLPLIRSKEFLWQEGHTAHLRENEALEMMKDIIALYARVYEEILAVPVIRGIKSKKEIFAGAECTSTIEAFIPLTGKGIQAATSHFLGTNFSKIFEINVEDPDGTGKMLPVYQTSWGLSTRSVGVCVMVHSDDRGLVLPPLVSSLQVVVIPCGIRHKEKGGKARETEEYAEEIVREIASQGIRVKTDLRTNVTPPYKYNHWELRGVPMRVDVGIREKEGGTVTYVLRDEGVKKCCKKEEVGKRVKTELEEMQRRLLRKARDERNSKMERIKHMVEAKREINRKRMVVMPWCTEEACEEDIKKKTEERAANGTVVHTGMKSLCILNEMERPEEGEKCTNCGKPAIWLGLFGRCY